MIPIRRLLALMLGLALATAALPGLAQSAADWYEVEVIAFLQQEPTGDDAELHPLNPPAPEASHVVSLRQPDAEQIPYAMLTKNDLKLAGVYRSLDQSDYYQPLLHIGWRQQGLSEEQAAAVAIPPDWQPWSQLDQLPLYGLIRFHKERYLHVAVDFRYRSPSAAAGDDLDVADATVVEMPAPIYVHQKSRRLRANELHYLDHPTLGVIVQV